MSMITEIYGLGSTQSDEFLQHEAVLIACYNAGIHELPQKTAEFFNTKYSEPCVLKEFRKQEVPFQNTLVQGEEEVSDIFEVVVADIPKGVDIIRFVNSY